MLLRKEGVLMIRLTDFEKKTSDPVTVEYVSTPSGDIPVYGVSSFHSLTQLIGFGKYMNKDQCNVYLRGQISLYDGYMSPSALRPKKIPGTNDFERINYEKRISYYKGYMHESLEQTKSFSKWNSNTIEPLLQHYGVRTNWIDIVDNVWVALWFSLHNTRSTIVDAREYIHISESAPDQYGYIFLMGCDAVKEAENQPGVYVGDTTIVVDLRKAVPSFFLRPHAQHGLMLRKRSTNSADYADYTDKIIAIAKISAADGLKWIGQTGLLSVQSLFPPPYYDTGYASLMNEYKRAKSCDKIGTKDYIRLYGSIQDITY